jgi:thiol-disulfide isomerase/thioredoxin
MRLSLCLFLILILAACGQDPAPAGAPATAPAQAGEPVTDTAAPAEGNPAVVEQTAERPNLVATTVDGQRLDLLDFRGRWLVVNFWATWCGPCLKEMPELSALHAMREQIKVVGLAYEDISVEEMKEFLQAHPVAYPVVIIDPLAPPADFATPRGLPTTYLIAPDGRVAHHFLGPVTAADIETAIAQAGK